MRKDLFTVKLFAFLSSISNFNFSRKKHLNYFFLFLVFIYGQIAFLESGGSYRKKGMSPKHYNQQESNKLPVI